MFKCSMSLYNSIKKRQGVLLVGLLEQRTNLQSKEIMTNPSYT